MSEQPIKQNQPTTLACPKCGGTLLIMTRKADRKRFLACRNFYDERVRCPYTENRIPEHLLMAEAGATPLPGFGEATDTGRARRARGEEETT